MKEFGIIARGDKNRWAGETVKAVTPGAAEKVDEMTDDDITREERAEIEEACFKLISSAKDDIERWLLCACAMWDMVHVCTPDLLKHSELREKITAGLHRMHSETKQARLSNKDDRLEYIEILLAGSMSYVSKIAGTN